MEPTGLEVQPAGADTERCPGCTRRLSRLGKNHNREKCMQVTAAKQVNDNRKGISLAKMQNRSTELQREVNQKGML